MTFDVAAHGLDSHYSPAQQERIRQLMLEDWAYAGVKLPTYMKLVARYIEKTGVSEEWLKKLRHQTMDNMLKKTFVPRYEFWACLHLYLNKKYGHQDITGQYAEDDIFGAAFVRYGGAKASPNSGRYQIGDRVIDITTEAGKSFAYACVSQTESIKALDDFTLDIENPVKGVAIQQGDKTLIVLRDVMTQAITMQELEQ
jgi:hypothetical protein